MSKLFKWTGTIAVMVMILVLATTAMAAGATKPQTWYLDSEPASANYLMEKDGTQSGEVSIPPKSGFKIWIADEAAETDVTFPSGDWGAHLCFTDGWAQNCDVEVGIWGWDGSAFIFTPFSTTDVDIAWNSNQNEITVMSQTVSETIKKGDYLALKIINGHGSSDHSVLTAGCSRLDSPCTDPGYPTPELTTGILLGLGLLGLGGFIFIKRRRAGRAA